MIDNNNLNSKLEQIAKVTKKFYDSGEKIGQFISSITSFESIERIKKFSNISTSTVATIYMNPFKERFESLLCAFQEAKNNPSSVINFYGYQKQLNHFHWAWPYNLEPAELSQILTQAESEEQFDKMLVSFFTKQRMEKMCAEIIELLPRKHKVIFRQITAAYNEKQYALANNAILSIIDNILSELIDNKWNTSRKGILKPIINFYAEEYPISEVSYLFFLLMLSNNIDMLFTNYDFNEKISVETSKKVRRHLSIHGFSYSNKRKDTIMLLNTLFALLDNQKYLKPFRNSLIKDRKTKEFIIKHKSYVIKNRIHKELSI